jgi:hypothetical protein
MNMLRTYREEWRKHFDDKSVNGLPLPPLLLQLLQTGRWKTPEDKVMLSVIPRLKEPVVFLGSIEHIAFESQGFLADDPKTAQLFHEYRGSCGIERTLPWRDVERSILLAVNRELGADLGVVLDYRSGPKEPSVLVSDWWTGDHTCHWCKVCDTFSEFVSLLDLE